MPNQPYFQRTLDLFNKKKTKLSLFSLSILFFALANTHLIYKNEIPFSTPSTSNILLIASLGVLMATLNSLELLLVGKLCNTRLRFGDSFKTTNYASALNLLPIPGAAIVRMGHLHNAGAPFKSSSLATLYSAFSALPISLCFSFLVIYPSTDNNLFLLLGLTGGVTAISIGLMGTYLFKQKKAIVFLFTVRFAILITESLKIFISIQALGEVASIEQAAALSFSSIAGLAASIVPAGIGIKEYFASLIASLTDLSSGSVFVAMSLMRIVDVSVIIALSLTFSKRRNA